LSPILAIEDLQNEVSFLTQQSIAEGREHLDDLEIEHLLKMTSDVVLKIKHSTLNDDLLSDTVKTISERISW